MYVNHKPYMIIFSTCYIDNGWNEESHNCFEKINVKCYKETRRNQHLKKFKKIFFRIKYFILSSIMLGLSILSMLSRFKYVIGLKH